MTRPIVIETRRGETVEVGPHRVTPEARVLLLHLPWGGWVWNRPSAVIVAGDGPERRIPIPDPWHGFRTLVGVLLALLVARWFAALARQAIVIERDSSGG